MKAIKLGLFFSLLLVFASCNNDDDDNNNGGTPEPPVADLTIYETAVASENLTILVEALERTGLDTTLDDPGTYTVFAPTDEAFTTAGVSLEDFTNEELTNLLLNHVLGTTVLSSSLSTGYVNTLATGPGENSISLFVNTEGGVEFNGVSSPLSDGLDINASNGVIHLVDTPLSIPNVVNHVVANPDFQSLEDAVLAFENELTDILTGEGPFTIFAPSNEAFANLADVLGTETVDPETLRTILLYHVVAGQNLQSDNLTAGLEMTTANEELLYMDSEEGTKLIDGTGGDGVSILTSDIQGSNGVIHEIDRVLLPPSIVNSTVGEANIYQLAKLTPGYSLLATAIEQAGLVDLLSNPQADLTVFAPNDAAFATYLSNFEGIDSLEDISEEDLANLLLNHLVQGQFSSSEIVAAGTGYNNTLATTPDGDNDYLSLYIRVEDGGVTLNGTSKVVFPDFVVSNGTVHLVDAIIDLPTVVTFATADPDFSSLADALEKVENSAGYVETLQTPWGTDPAPFTVFAPDNAAFADLLADLGADSLNDIDPDLVAETLAYHVVAGTNARADDISSGPLETLGGEVTVTAGAGVSITDANGRVSNVTAANVQAYNGVIHVIDAVILPLIEF
ncbi:fasciclin domain-containing protein [Robertkochia flava]|uniref:fasciclin domain-containing protein n=1 Tax=Robertkochia flava TaxID=3447986 RepID=UPI001CCEA482|nr:fasciclin domain-containing protein [Robertkochia marina]